MGKINLAIKSLKYLWNQLNDIVNEYGGFKLFYFFDWLLTYFIHGASPKDYIFYDMFEKKGIVRRNIITNRRNRWLDKKFNDYSKDVSQFGNKFKFLTLIKDKVSRGFILTKESSEEEALNFLSKHKRLFCKPVVGTQGKGIFVIEDNYEGKKRIADIYANDEEFLLEEEIVNHKKINSINPYCVNSVRINTVLKKNGDVEIVSACLKTSADDSFVDNLTNDGFAFPIDLKTGLISGPGRSLVSRKKVLVHPVTNTVVIGLEIPFFSKAKDLCKESAKLFPDFRYLGWDLAVTEVGIEIIETNSCPGPRLAQVDGIYKYNLIKNLY